MIKVIDDIIDKEYQENIKTLFYKNQHFSWFYVDDITNKDKGLQRRPGFRHGFVTGGKSVSNCWPLIQPLAKAIADKINVKGDVIEARSFLQLPLNQKFIGSGVDTPHIDTNIPHTVFLYYVNTTDGETVIYDYKSKIKDKEIVDVPFFEDIKVLKKVKPKQGRCVIFDGSYWHTSVQPKKDVRAIINFNISTNGT